MQIGKYSLPIEDRTCIMGILNVTPDSFTDGGKYLDPERARLRCLEMAAEGADIIDIGGESSRPGSERISTEEELRRVMPVIKTVRDAVDIPLSIDTCKSEVARAALDEGVQVVNDITAVNGDPRIAEVISAKGAGVVLMHMKGTPEDMQDAPSYSDTMNEICSYLKEAVDLARQKGISSDKIMIDPGIGFGKRIEDNLSILKGLQHFKKIGQPVLIGVSRKSFIGSITGKEPEERIYGTAAACAAAVMNGADILRVHDIDAMRDVARVAEGIAGS